MHLGGKYAEVLLAYDTFWDNFKTESLQENTKLLNIKTNIEISKLIYLQMFLQICTTHLCAEGQAWRMIFLSSLPINWFFLSFECETEKKILHGFYMGFSPQNSELMSKIDRAWQEGTG